MTPGVQQRQSHMPRSGDVNRHGDLSQSAGRGVSLVRSLAPRSVYVQVAWREAMALVDRLDRATFTRQNEGPERPDGCTP